MTCRLSGQQIHSLSFSPRYPSYWAWAGDKIIIAKSGKPYLDLIPHKPVGIPRKPGKYKGQIKMADGFDQTPIDIIEDFEGGSSWGGY